MRLGPPLVLFVTLSGAERPSVSSRYCRLPKKDDNSHGRLALFCSVEATLACAEEFVEALSSSAQGFAKKLVRLSVEAPYFSRKVFGLKVSFRLGLLGARAKGSATTHEFLCGEPSAARRRDTVIPSMRLSAPRPSPSSARRIQLSHSPSRSAFLISMRNRTGSPSDTFWHKRPSVSCSC